MRQSWKRGLEGAARTRLPSDLGTTGLGTGSPEWRAMAHRSHALRSPAQPRQVGQLVAGGFPSVHGDAGRYFFGSIVKA